MLASWPTYDGPPFSHASEDPNDGCRLVGLNDGPVSLDDSRVNRPPWDLNEKRRLLSLIALCSEVMPER